MIRKVITLAICLFSFSSFALTSCPQALPANQPGFCETFKTSVTCFCSNTLPKRMCENINQIYQLMIARYGSIEIACKFQRETSVQICLDDWRCYKNGGVDSQGGPCNGSGQACI